MIITPTLRRKAFKAALAAANVTMEHWAHEHRLGPHHVGLVAAGKRLSLSLNEQMDEYIIETLVPFMQRYTAGHRELQRVRRRQLQTKLAAKMRMPRSANSPRLVVGSP